MAAIIVSILQKNFQVFPKIQETALIVQANAKLIKGNSGTVQHIDDKSYIIRSKGSAELSVFLSGEGFFDYFSQIGNIPQHYAHDIVVCNGFCDYKTLKQIVPPVLAEISFKEKQENFSLLFSKEAPLDLIVGCGIAYNTMFPIERRIELKGHPFVEVGLPRKSLKSTESLLDALNRMVNIFIHGQMLFKRNDQITIPVAPLFISSFITVIPLIIGSFSNFSLLLCIVGLISSFIGSYSGALFLAASSLFSESWLCSGLGVAIRILILMPCSPDLADETSLIASSALVIGFVLRKLFVSK